jgi:hypothetical protein
LVFEKTAKFFAENYRKSQKIVIITSTPGIGSDHELSVKTAKTDPSNRPQDEVQAPFQLATSPSQSAEEDPHFYGHDFGGTKLWQSACHTLDAVLTYIQGDQMRL